MRPLPVTPQDPTAELQETLDDFGALHKLWLAYKSPCSKESCPICQSKSDEMQGKEDDKDDEDDDEDDNDRNEEEDEEDEEGDEDISSSRKSRKWISKKRPDSTGQQSPLQEVDVQKSTQASKHRKNLKNTERLDDFSSLR